MAPDSRNDQIFSHWEPHRPMHDPPGIRPAEQQAAEGGRGVKAEVAVDNEKTHSSEHNARISHVEKLINPREYHCPTDPKHPSTYR